MATAKKAPVKKAPAKKAVAKPSATRKSAGSRKTAAPARSATTKKKAAPSKRAAPAKKAAPAAVKKKATAKRAVPPVAKKKAAPSKQIAAVAKKAARPVIKTTVPPAPKTTAPAKKAAATPAKKAGPAVHVIEPPAVKGVTKDGVAYTKDFDVKFLTAQRALLLEEKAALLGQAVRLEDEANSLIEEQEMGDVQFDDEGGEGDTMVVERERDLTLSAQARQTIADIESALERLATGRYGYSSESGRPIPRERLQAIPWATMLVEEKVGGIGRR